MSRRLRERFAKARLLTFSVSNRMAYSLSVSLPRFQDIHSLNPIFQERTVEFTTFLCMVNDNFGRSGKVDRLALQLLVSREAGTEDRRQVYVKLTSRGVEVLEKLTFS